MTARRWLVSLASLLALGGCERKKVEPAPPSAIASTPPAPRSSAPATPSSRSIEKDESERASLDAGLPAGSEPKPVGPAAPASASARGVVMITKDDEVVLLPFEGKAERELAKTSREADAFRAHARGPAIAGDLAYWVSRGRLVRRRIGGGPLETLADDARDGTRVAATVVGEGSSARAVAAYLARDDDLTLARLWVDGHGSVTLTPDGAAASSVALAASGSDLVALSLEGRTGMTPLHARVADLSGRAPVLDGDVVAWVAGPAQSHTEVAAVASNGAGIWAFVPLERDITRFGLAVLNVGAQPKMSTPVTWRAYPNGIDPAPVAATVACNGALVAYATPAGAKPDAPRELALAELGADGLGAPRTIARAAALSNVSLASAADGVLVTYVSGSKTWASVVPCSR